MEYSTLSEDDPAPLSDVEVTTLTALWLATERASANYLTARKAWRRRTWQEASLRRLADEQPDRADYRAAAQEAQSATADAKERTDLAQAARDLAWRVYDAKWTATAGRRPVSAVA